MKKKKVVYCLGSSFGTQYALSNVSGYGTKWEVTLKKNFYGCWEILGTARLLDSNCVINEEFREDVQETDEFLDDILYP
jgi:hypothetical protein